MPGCLVGQDDAFFQSEEKCPPLAAALIVVDCERKHVEFGRAPASLGDHRILIGGALREQSPGRQSHAHEDEGDGKLVGDVLEMITDLHSGRLAPAQKMQIVDDQEARVTGQDVVHGAVREVCRIAARDSRWAKNESIARFAGIQGPRLHSRGFDPESEAFFYLDELASIIREWVAVVYHHRPHDSLVDPHVPGLRMSPAMMFEHGMARAGFIEAPRDPDLAYEFLKTEWRKVQHYGVDFGGRRYNGASLNPYRNMTSPYTGKAKGRWPIHHDPDDVTRIYFRDPETRAWSTLMWEHARVDGHAAQRGRPPVRPETRGLEVHLSDDRLAVAEPFFFFFFLKKKKKKKKKTRMRSLPFRRSHGCW